MTDKFKKPSNPIKEISKEESEMRKPLPPEILISALQDPIHKNINNSRLLKRITKVNDR